MANYLINNKLGFSIIELVFVILFLGIIISITFPDFFSFSIFTDFQNTSKVLINFIHTAKNNQILEPQNVWKVLVDNNTIYLIRDGTVYDKYSYSKNILVDNFSDTEIRFNSDGTTAKTTGYNLILTNEDKKYIIEVDNITGYIDLQIDN